MMCVTAALPLSGVEPGLRLALLRMGLLVAHVGIIPYYNIQSTQLTIAFPTPPIMLSMTDNYPYPIPLTHLLHIMYMDNSVYIAHHLHHQFEVMSNRP